MTAFRKFIKPATALAVLATMGTVPMTAFAQDVSVSTGVDLVSDYVFRGGQPCRHSRSTICRSDRR